MVALSGLNYADAQTPVTLFTSGQFVSYLGNGTPNAFGCVFTYASGTTTPLGTYTDYTGTTLNANPVVLFAGGTANIWLQSGVLYSITVKTSGGVNCVSGSTVYSASGLNQSLLNLPNEWFSPQIFDQPISILAPDLQIVFGSPAGTRTTLDIPPTSSDLILHGPPITADDTLVSQNATQTLTNKNLTTGTQINGCGITNGPGTYLCIANSSSTATVLNELAVLTGAPSTATVAPTTAKSGVVGIVTAGAGITGNATIQQSGGPVNCLFDGATTAGDYVQISPGGGDCHDAGASYPTSAVAGTGQVIGRVLATGTGLEPVNLFGPEIQPPPPSLGNILGQAVATVAAGPAAGTGPTINCNTVCHDNGDPNITITTGSAPPSNGIIFTITFGGVHNISNCTFSATGAGATAALATQIYMVANPTNFQLWNAGPALAATTTYAWSYICTFD